MNTRTDAEGNKVLFLEEVQSDWGQKGKKDGLYKDPNKVSRWRIAIVTGKQIGRAKV